MDKNSIVMVVPNTKEGLAMIRSISKQLVENKIFIRLVTKKEFDLKYGFNKKGASNAR